MSLGTILKTKRAALGMTLDEVAYATGMSKSHLHSIEGDRSEPGIVICARLSVTLGLPVQAMASAALTHALRTTPPEGTKP
jgi:transcriptional regulator with XRE-family HTH domain